MYVYKLKFASLCARMHMTLKIATHVYILQGN